MDNLYDITFGVLDGRKEIIGLFGQEGHATAFAKLLNEQEQTDEYVTGQKGRDFYIDINMEYTSSFDVRI